MFTIILFHMALLNLWHGRQAKKVSLNMRKLYGFTPTGKRRLRNVASTLCARLDSCPACSLIRAFDLDSYILQYPMSLLAGSEDPDQAVHPRSLPSGPSLSTYV